MNFLILTLLDASSRNEHLMPLGPSWPEAKNTYFYAFKVSITHLSTYFGTRTMTYYQFKPLKNVYI